MTVLQLSEANIKKDVKIIENTLPLIEEVRDLWYEVNRKIKLKLKTKGL